MRHRRRAKNLGRDSAHQKAMMMNLAKSLVTYEVIQTTEAKAKMLRRMADKLITLGKHGRLHDRRRAIATLGGDRALAAKIFDDLAKREAIASRQGGYTRIIKLANRQGDNAPIVRISWVGSDIENTAHLRFPASMLEDFEDDDDEG